MELGGVTTWSIKMAGALAARGQQATLIEHVCPETDWAEPIPDDVRLVRHSGRRPAMARLQDIPDYVSVYRGSLPCTLVPNYSPGAYAACAALARRHSDQVRVVGLAHSDQPYYYDLLEYYESIVQRFVAVSHEVAGKLAARLPHRQDDILVRPYGVEVPRELCRTYSSGNQPLQLVFAGRLVEEQKCVSDLVRLVEALIARNVSFRLRIIGEGTDKHLVADGIRDLGPSADSCVQLMGRAFADEMAKIWRSADVCILVSRYEGTSISMLEAMAQGCAPVVTKVSGSASLILPGDNGFLSGIGESDVMADLLRTLDQDRACLQRVGFQAYRTVAASYCLQEYVEWFATMTQRLWREPSRAWAPKRRDSLFPPGWHFQEERFLGRVRGFAGRGRRLLSRLLLGPSTSDT